MGDLEIPVHPLAFFDEPFPVVRVRVDDLVFIVVKEIWRGVAMLPWPQVEGATSLAGPFDREPAIVIRERSRTSCSGPRLPSG